MTAKEEFRKARCEAESHVKRNELNFIVYMSGTKRKKTMLEKNLRKYREDSNLNFELGVISEEIHDFEMKACEILEKSIKNYIIF